MHHIVKPRRRRRWRWSSRLGSNKKRSKIPRLVSHTKHHFLYVQTHTHTHSHSQITCRAIHPTTLKNQADQVKHCCLQMWLWLGSSHALHLQETNTTHARNFLRKWHSTAALLFTPDTRLDSYSGKKVFTTRFFKYQRNVIFKNTFPFKRDYLSHKLLI